jgi:hypothetical protein
MNPESLADIHHRKKGCAGVLFIVFLLYENWRIVKKVHVGIHLVPEEGIVMITGDVKRPA